MRILEISNGYPPRAFGGVELHTHRLVAALARRGHAVSVFTRHSDLASADGTIIDEQVDGIHVRSVVNDAKQSGFEAHWRSDPVREAFAELLDRERPEVVHVQHLIGLSHDLPATARQRGLRVVATVHEYWYACARVMLLRPDGATCPGPAHADCERCFLAGTRGEDPGTAAAPTTRSTVRLALARHLPAAALRALLTPVAGGAAPRARFADMRAALGAFERVTTPSRFVIDELARHGLVLPRTTRTIPLGIDRSGLPVDPPAPPPPGATLRIAVVGHVLPHKGIHTLLEAAARLPAAPLEIHLHGRRWPEHPYEQRIGPLLVADPRVHAHGAFADGALPRLLAGADVVAVPSSCPESFGIAAREAHLAGRPVLCADRGALPEAVRDGIDGLLLPADDPDAWADALRRLIDEPELRARLAAGARTRAAEIPDMDTYAAEIERFLLRP